MADEKPEIKAVPPPASMAVAKREKRVTKLTHRLETMERAIDVVLRDQEDLFFTYVAFYRLRHGCDPDTSDCPTDYLDQFTSADEETQEP